jgi:hypothetical protein
VPPRPAANSGDQAGYWRESEEGIAQEEEWRTRNDRNDQNQERDNTGRY